MGVHPNFRKIVKTLKNILFYFPVWNSYWQLRFANSIWSIRDSGLWSPQHRLQSTPPHMETPTSAGVFVEFVLLTSSSWSVVAERGFSYKLIRSHGVNCNQSASQQAWESPLLIAPAVTSNIDRTVWGTCIRFFISRGTCIIHHGGAIWWKSSSSEMVQCHKPL